GGAWVAPVLGLADFGPFPGIPGAASFLGVWEGEDRGAAAFGARCALQTDQAGGAKGDQRRIPAALSECFPVALGRERKRNPPMLPQPSKGAAYRPPLSPRRRLSSWHCHHSRLSLIAVFKTASTIIFARLDLSA